MRSFVKSSHVLLVILLGCFSFNTLAQTVLEEVTVTARKRNESYQEVPVSVTAFSESAIKSAGIESPADFVALSPNITLVNTQNEGTSFITIRGISQARNSEPSAAVIIDGVLMANPSQFNQDLFDIEHIEVLRGPQGALYGRNAIGGAIIINTKQPTDQFEGSVTLGADSGPGIKAIASASGPVPNFDNLKYNAAFYYKDTDGYIENTYLHQKADPYRDIAGHVKLLWKPTDNLTADARFSISHVKTQALYFTIGATADTILPVRVNNPGQNNRDMYNVSLKLDYDTDYGTITSITSYDDLQELLTGDNFDFLPRAVSFLNTDPSVAGFKGYLQFLTGDSAVDLSQTQYLDTSSWSQEIRFTSPAENRFRWIGGAYLIGTKRFISTGNQLDRGNGVFPVYRTPRPYYETNPTDPSPQLGLLEDGQDNFAWAVFASMSYDITDDLEGTASLRYDEDTRQNTTLTKPPYDSTDPDGIYGPLPGLTTYGLVRTHTWKAWQPKFTLRWKPSDNLTLYGDWSRGFRSGGFNQSGVGGLGIAGVGDLFDAETANTFEAGAKWQLYDKRLDLNLSAYTTAARGAYFFVYDPNTGTQNLGTLNKVIYTGLEFEGAAALAEGLDANFAVGWTDSTIKDSDTPSQIGNQAPLVSDYTLNLGLQYRHPLQISQFGGVTGFVRVDYQRIGDTYWEPDNYTVRSPVDLVNLRVGLETGNNWSITFWSKNLFDKQYNAEFSPGPYGRPYPYGYSLPTNFLWKGEPMRWGIDVTKKF